MPTAAAQQRTPCKSSLTGDFTYRACASFCSAAPKVLCEDLDANCPEWAINKWICSNDDMRANCRASCRTCERGSARGQLRVRLRDAASEALIHEFDWLSIEPVERAYELRYNHTESSAMDVRLEFDLGSTRQASGSTRSPRARAPTTRRGPR